MTSKKLLVLDVNGLLVDTYFHKEPLPEESPDARVGNFYVYKRPFCEEFLQFCLNNFTVGVWSSAREYNVNNLVDYVFGDTKEKLAFSWHQSDCTDLGLKSPDNQWKPLFLKELSKLWRRVKVDLPWSEGSYGPSNTLLVDDTPYKAILNPPNTAIFPRSYTARDRRDNFLGGALRSYLEGIRDAASVQTYVESNPFGEPSITPANPLWSYVNEVVLKVKSVLNKVGDGVAQIMPVEAVSDKGNKEDKWQNGKRKHSDPSQPVEVVNDERNKEDKPKRWRSRNQKYHSDLSHFANNHLQSSDFDFPSEVVELQSSELQSSDRMLQRLGSGVHVHDATASQQVHEIANPGSQEIVDIPLDQSDRICSHLNQDQERPSQVGKGISLPSRLEKPTKDERSSLFTELGNCDGDGEKRCENTGIIEQGHHGSHEAAKQAQGDLKGIEKEHEEGNQASSIHDENQKSFDKQGYNEGPFHIRDAGIDAELDRSHEQHCDDADENIHGEGNESFEKSHIPVGDGGLKSSKPYCMRTESNNEELFCGRREMRNNNFFHASNYDNSSQHHSTYSNRRWDKHRGTWDDLNKWHNQRNDTNRGSFRYGQGWKSEGGWKSALGGRTQMPFSKDSDQRGQQHMKYIDRNNSGKGYLNRIKPSFGHARHSQHTWGDRPVDATAPAWGASYPDTRSWDQSQQDSRQFSNTRVSTTQAFSSQRDIIGRVRKYNEYGRDQDGGPLSTSRHQGFEQGAICEPNVWPERTEQLNVRGNGKRQRLDFASREAGASSQPHRSNGAYGASRQPYQNVEASSQFYRNAGAFSQPYRGQHEASRPRYQASTQPNHNNWDNYRPPGGFSRSRQSQEVGSL